MMRLYETTSTFTQKDSNIPKRHAYYLHNVKMVRLMAVVFVAMGILFGIASLQHSVLTSAVCMVMFGAAAAICIPVGSWSSKRVAANYYEDGDNTWTMTTWFDNEGIHRIDEDEFVFPLKSLCCAYRAGNVLLLCTKTQAVVPVNLTQLSETDRKSVFEQLKTACPKLKMLQTK